MVGSIVPTRAPPATDEIIRAPLFARSPAFATPKELADWLGGIVAARAEWVGDFDDVQWSLGRAFYTHLEQDKESLYFAEAARSDALVERAAPGLQARMCAAVATMTGEPVVARAGWCGPGVHIFPANGWLALHGGEVHFDLEGMSDAEIKDGAPALTLVLMLQPAARGGELGVWDIVHGAGATESAPRPPDALVAYEPGDLVAIDSRRLHQIQPFAGSVDRISATVHAVRTRGRWECWF